MKDQLKPCHCGKSDACYEQKAQAGGTPIRTFMCYGCGFLSNSLMREGKQFMKEQLDILPELYKDVMWEDEFKQKWIPSTINIPKMGMVFLNGPNKDDVKWTGVLAVPVTEEEKLKYPIPGKSGEYYEWRIDMESKKDFDRYDFIGALEYIGVLPKDEEVNESVVTGEINPTSSNV